MTRVTLEFVSDENIQLEFENDFITDGRERGEYLRLRLPIRTF